MQNLPFLVLLLFASLSLTAQDMFVKDDEGNTRTTGGENVLMVDARNGTIYTPNDDDEVAVDNADGVHDLSNAFYLEITGADSERDLIQIALRSSGNYIHLNANMGEVNMVYGSGTNAKFYALNASPSGQVGHYRLFHQDSGLYLAKGSGGVISTTHRADDALVVAFTSVENDEQVYDCYRKDPEARVVYLESVEQFKRATKTSSPRCGSNSFFDPIDGGSCWSCPAGYQRTVAAVNSNKACERPASSDFRKADDRGKGTGILGTDCPGGAFLDPNGRCYSCPSGYKRTVYAVTSGKACEKVISAATTSATKTGSYSCPSGSFFDLIDGGSCWSCPDGYQRTVFSVNGAKACELK